MTDHTATTNLSPAEKRALLAQLLQQKANETKSVYPLSYAQRALWFLYEFEPQSTAFNIMCALRIWSEVNVAALRKAFQALINRHPILRTTYSTAEHGPVQQIHAQQEVAFVEIDAANWDLDRIRQQVIAQADQPFDLERGPMLRVHLFTRAPQDHVLQFTVHHIAADLWGVDILLDELRTLYIAENTATPATLPQLKAQYTDFVRWQKDLLSSPQGERMWSYWQQQLAGDLPILNLPTDRPRPPVQTYNGASHAFRIDDTLTQQIKRLAQTEQVTPYVTLLAAFEVLLQRYTSQDDILIGTPAVGRSQKEQESILGCFVNHLVLRANLAGDPSFKSLLDHIRQLVLSTLDHQDYPFNLLVERLQPVRDPSRSPLFQVVFIWDKLRRVEEQGASPFLPLGLDATTTRIDWEGLQMEPFAMEQRGAAFDLTLIIFEGSNELAGTFLYNTDLFDATTIARMAGHFQTLLAGLVAAPSQRISQLPLLSEPEQHQLLVEWNDTHNYPEQCLHELFEAQVAHSPHAPAIVFDGQTLSYAQLDAHSNRLAQALHDLGVQPGQPIAMMLEHGPRQIIAQLGALKAGGAFVCLDPQYPVGRLEHILGETEPPFFITDAACLAQHQTLIARTQEQTNCQVIALDLSDAQVQDLFPRSGSYGTDLLASYPATKPAIVVSPQSPAYIVYTSGSTGKPKGIVQSHRSFSQFVTWQSKQFDMVAPKRIAQWASITYDASYCEIFGALCFGATLCLAAPATKYDPAKAIEWVRDEQITLLQVVPSFCRQILRALGDNTQALSSLEVLMLAGEVVPVELATAWRTRFPQVRVFNLYGPTESVLATYAAVDTIQPGQRSIPVGRAIDGRQILILDQAGHPCPIGVRGEIYIRSQYLTLGYFKQPETTARAFVQNPLHNDYPDPTYRTGDAGRWLADGNVEFLGRIDNQIKIRGMRVEMEEIEATILQFQDGAVHECAVVVQEFGADDRRLVAYVAAPGEIVASALRAFLKERLPEHMVPARFVFLDQLPRTPNGKIDRKAMPAPSDERPATEANYVAPSTPTETMLAELWRELLQVDQVGIYDNFFELGGHSLLAAQVVNKIHETYMVDFSLRDFFESPTVARLAERIEAAQGGSNDIDMIAQLLSDVQQLSDDDVRHLLGENAD